MLPARLKGEMDRLADAILAGKDIRKEEELEKHADWVDEFLPKYEPESRGSKDALMEILHKEIGNVFMQVLEDSGVYKRTDEGRAAFERFLNAIE